MIDTQAENWLCELLPHVVSLAREAGRAIMGVYSEPNPAVEYKQDKSPLTQADLASHHVILNGLAQLSPDWPILSEEASEVPFDLRKSWQYFWMVDPLDGTKEFLRRSGEFTVNIALINANNPILGVVYGPAIDVLYFAARGAGAWKASGEVVSQIKAARAVNGSVRMVVSRSHRSSEDKPSRSPGIMENWEVIAMGSSLKFCLIAEGSADVYTRTGPTMEWDTAAAHLILQEAGGMVTDLDGNSLHYNKPVLLNPSFLAKGLC
jgi:3'(2'), 5'-bisphosphate nucleotidase